jgi:hypothetical protein
MEEMEGCLRQEENQQLSFLHFGQHGQLQQLGRVSIFAVVKNDAVFWEEERCAGIQLGCCWPHPFQE